MSQPLDFCEHEDMRAEIITTNYMGNDGVGEYNTEVYVCDHCDEVIDPAVADPNLDRLEAQTGYYE